VQVNRPIKLPNSAKKSLLAEAGFLVLCIENLFPGKGGVWSYQLDNLRRWIREHYKIIVMQWIILAVKGMLIAVKDFFSCCGLSF